MRSFVRIAMILAIAALAAAEPALSQGVKKSARKRLGAVDGLSITESDVRKEAAAELEELELQNLKTKAVAARSEHEILERALRRLIEENLLQAEAERQGIAREALIAKEIDGKVQAPTDADIDAFYEENQSRIGRAKEDVKDRIRTYLEERRKAAIRQAYVDTLKQTHKVQKDLPPFRFPVDGAGRPSLGKISAPVTLIVFSDFECPYCRNFSETLRELHGQYGDRIRIVFRQFPLSRIHPHAVEAAHASLCAGAQGRFWEMHDLLFEEQEKLGRDDLKSKAARLKLEVKAFDACLDSKRYAAQVREDLRAGAAAGVDGTPALFVNGRSMPGDQGYDDIVATIEDELRELKLNR